MSTCKRHRKKWSINEILSLQREHELLNLDLQTIANKHSRSINSIIHKLFAEGFTATLLLHDKSKTKEEELSYNDASNDQVKYSV